MLKQGARTSWLLACSWRVSSIRSGPGRSFLHRSATLPLRPRGNQRFCRPLSSSPPVALWSLLPTSGLERPAVVVGENGMELSHRELQDLSLSFAGRLTRDLGYGVGDKLAVVMGGHNCIESVIAHLGAAAAGITVVTSETPDDKALQGCRGMLVSVTVLQGRSPQGILMGEQHAPIVAHDDYVESSPPMSGSAPATAAHFWQRAGECSPIDTSLVVTDPFIPLAIYGDAKASERRVTQGQMCQLAMEMTQELSLSNLDRIVLAAPLHLPFGFGSSVLAALTCGGRVILPSQSPYSLTHLLAAMKGEEATVMMCDTHMLKLLNEDILSHTDKDTHSHLSSSTFRAGVVKVGSGNGFNLGPSRILWGVALHTLGRPLPISNRCS